MEEQVKISIIVPVYNTEPYLCRCIDSLINQTLHEIEIICVDDCSTDNSLQILNMYALKDRRVKIIHLDKNVKAGGSRNKGIEIARGKYITFIDSDDYVNNDYCQKLLEPMLETNADLVICNVKNYIQATDSSLQEIKEVLDHNYEQTIWENGIYALNLYTSFNKFRTGPVAKLYKKSLFDKYNLKFPENLIQEDEAFYWYYMTVSKSFYYINEDLYIRLIHNSSIMHNKLHHKKNIYDHLEIMTYIYKFLKNNKLWFKYKNLYSIYFSNISQYTLSLCEEEKDRKKCKRRIEYLKYKCGIAKIINFVFSVKNKYEERCYKVITILGLKCTFRNKKKEKEIRLENERIEIRAQLQCLQETNEELKHQLETIHEQNRSMLKIIKRRFYK